MSFINMMWGNKTNWAQNMGGGGGVSKTADRDWAGILKNGEHIPLIILGRRPKTADWELMNLPHTKLRLSEAAGWFWVGMWGTQEYPLVLKIDTLKMPMYGSHTIFKINILINLEFIMFYIIKILRTKSNQFINTYLFYFDLVIMVLSWWNIYILLYINILNFEVSLSKNLLSIHYSFSLI